MPEPTLMMQVFRETVLGQQRAAPDGDLTRLTFRCGGIEGCPERVEDRGAICKQCLADGPRHRRAARIATTRERLSPGGALDFCLPGNETYQQTTRLALDAARAMALDKRKEALAVIEHAACRRSNGGMLLLGPTGIGKSKVLVAIGLRILREAEATPDLDDASFRFATGIEYVSGVRMARAAREQRLGEIATSSRQPSARRCSFSTRSATRMGESIRS
jgi:hypothetical protein